jgi:hypothetical protein
VFNDGVSTSEFAASNRGMIGDKWSGEDVEGSNCGFDLRYYPGIFLGY